MGSINNQISGIHAGDIFTDATHGVLFFTQESFDAAMQVYEIQMKVYEDAVGKYLQAIQAISSLDIPNDTKDRMIINLQQPVMPKKPKLSKFPRISQEEQNAELAKSGFLPIG